MGPVTLLLMCVVVGAAEKPPTAEDLAPHASGVCLAEVVELEEIDWRPGDGNLFLRATLRVIRGSGAIPAHVDIVKEYGGLRPAGSPLPKPVLRPDSVVKGRRYWFAFCSAHEDRGRHVKYPEGVINCWPEETPGVAQALDEAVRADRYRWKPQYDPQTGVTYGHLAEPGKDQWSIRVEKDGKALWHTAVPGEKAARATSWCLFPRDHVHDLSLWADRTRSEAFLLAETATMLGPGNEFGLPAAKYYVNTAFDIDTGRRAAVWVSTYQQGYAEWLFRTYELDTGRARRERCFDWVPEGGKKQGWLRKIVRTFDPATGRKTSEEVFRFAQVKGKSEVLTSTWLKVKGDD